MGENLLELAKIHKKGFLVGQGFIDPHAEYLEKHLSPQELEIGARQLMADPEARLLLITAFRQFHSDKNVGDNDVAELVIRQINLARSAVIYGALGYLDD